MKLSVVMPCHNRREVLALTLESLAQQTFPASEFEVIVVDQAATDDNPAMPAVPKPESHAPIIWLDALRAIAAIAAERSCSIRHAVSHSGPFVAAAQSARPPADGRSSGPKSGVVDITPILLQARQFRGRTRE